MIATRSGRGAAPRPALPTRTRVLFLVLVSLLAALPAIGLVITAGGAAGAHGTLLTPGSRAFLCRPDALAGWTADGMSPDGRTADSLWSGDAGYGGLDVMVHTVGHDGSPAPGEGAAFGYVSSGSGGVRTTFLPCRTG